MQLQLKSPSSKSKSTSAIASVNLDLDSGDLSGVSGLGHLVQLQLKSPSSSPSPPRLRLGELGLDSGNLSEVRQVHIPHRRTYTKVQASLSIASCFPHLTSPSDRSSTLRLPSRRSCRGETMVVPLHDTILVRTYNYKGVYKNRETMTVAGCRLGGLRSNVN